MTSPNGLGKGERSMNSLFDLVGEYKELYAMLTEEPEDETINDTLDGVIGEIEVKSEGYISLINRLDMELDACKKHRDQWINNVKVRENAIKRLKERLASGMMMMGTTELKAGDNTIKLQKNGGKLPLIFCGDTPKEYLKTTITFENDQDKIRKALDEGQKLDFVEYGERGSHIVIK